MACQSNIPPLVKFNAIYRKNIENLCLVQIILHCQKLKLQAICDVSYVHAQYIYDDTLSSNGLPNCKHLPLVLNKAQINPAKNDTLEVTKPAYAHQ